jgi:tetratricopeptide (TPR) repeat protein
VTRVPARLLRCVATALLALTLSAAAQDLPEAARSLMEEADRAREANHIDDAIAKYRRAIEVAPSLASAYVNLGALYFNQGKSAEAYDTFIRGVAAVPTDRTLLSNAAAAAQQVGKSAEALKFVDAAIERSARDAALHALRSTILRSLNRNDDALAAITRATQLAADEPKYQFTLGNLLAPLGRRDDAIAAYRRAVQLDKTFLRAYYNLGAVLFDAGRYDEALDAYRMALAPIDQAFAAHQPVEVIHARAYANLGAIYLKQQQWDAAIQAYAKSARLDDGTAAHYNLGFLYFTTGKFDRAEQEYRKALAGDPSLPLAYLHLGTIAFRAAKYDDAIRLLRDGLPHFGTDEKRAALRMLGRAQWTHGDAAAARASLQDAVDLDAHDAESLLLLGRIARHDRRTDEAKTLLDRAHAAAPQNQVITLEQALVARDANDLVAERAALEALPPRDVIRTELAVIAARQNPSAASLRALKIDAPDVAAVLDALDGRRDAAARVLAASASPLARGDAGLLLWELGRTGDAKPYLAAAHQAFAEWSEVTLAAGEIALAEKRYDDADRLLSSIRCDAKPQDAIVGSRLDLTLGADANVCGRARQSLAQALLAEAVDDVERAAKREDDAAGRRARQLADRAGSLDERYRGVAWLVRGTVDLVAGDDASARDELSRATGSGLPPALAAIARANLQAAQPLKETPADEEPVSSQPRRTVVVFLPDTPAENDKKLAEAATSIVNALAAESSLPLRVELFRRAADARAFVAANRDRVGVMITNPEVIASGFTPRYALAREGRTTYRRVVVVPAASSARTLGDLAGKSITAVDALGDDGVHVTTRVPDDLTAVANALYGRTAAALVAENNPLLAEHARELRVVHTTAPQSLPVVAFAAMPANDRAALDDAMRKLPRAALAPLQLTGLTRIGNEPHAAAKREVQTPTLAMLGLRLDPPPRMPLRVSVDLPRVDIPEDLFGKP